MGGSVISAAVRGLIAMRDGKETDDGRKVRGEHGPDGSSGAGAVDPVHAYLRQISVVPLLTASEEVELATRIEAGVLAAERLRRCTADETGDFGELMRELRRVIADGQRAMEHFVRANLRLVVSVAKRYAGRGMPLSDLIQEGNCGLIRAVEKFDAGRGFKFSTYATWWVRQSISRAMAEQSRTIRIPAHMIALINRLARARWELLVVLGHEPSLVELAARMNLSPERVSEIQQCGREPLSLDQRLHDDGDEAVGDVIEDTNAGAAENIVEHDELQNSMRTALATLTEREAGVLRLRFGFIDGRRRTLDEVGRAYGVTRERIRQIEARALTALRNPARAHMLRGHL